MTDLTKLSDAELLAMLPKQAPEPAPQPSRYSPQNIAGAAIEPNLSMLSGMIATPLSGLMGLAGTALPGEHGQGARMARQVSEGLTYQPRTQGGKDAQEVIGAPFRKIEEGADWAGEKAAELSGSPAVGAGSKAAISGAQAALFAALLKGTPPAETLQGKAGIGLMQSAVKPILPDLKSGDAKRALITMLDEGVNATMGGMEKASRTTRTLDDQVKDAVANSTATANVPTVGSSLRSNWNNAINQVNPEADMAAVRGAWDEFKNSPQVRGKVDIPVQLAQALKQGTYRALGNKSYGELGTASTEAQKALASGLRQQVAAKVPEVVAPLKREAALMNVKDVAERRALQEANKNPQGLAALRVDNPMAWMGFMADKSALIKSMLARSLYSSADPRMTRLLAGSSAVSEGNQ